MWNDGIEHHDIGNKSKHQIKGICFHTWLFSNTCPIDGVVTNPTFPTRNRFVTEVLLSMHHLGTDNSENDIDLGKETPTHHPLEHTSPMSSEISNSEVDSSNHDRHG